jgi:hypothetical protein
MTVTSLNYYSFAFNNFVFGGTNSPYQVTSVEGLEALPDLRVQDSDRGYQDGMITGRDFFGGRTITITMLTLGNSSGSAQYNHNLLQAALQPQQTGTTPLQFQLSAAGGLQFVNARVRRGMTIVDPDYTYGLIKSQYSFYCADPRYYDNTTQTATMAISSPLGRSYNRTYPLTFGGGSQTSTALINNAGTTSTYPTITVGGPVTNPIIGSLTTGQSLSFNYTMSTSDVIAIDLLNKTILLNGSPARNLLLGSSQWFAAAPGNNSFYFNGSGTTAGTTYATVQWNNAYI